MKNISEETTQQLLSAIEKTQLTFLEATIQWMKNVTIYLKQLELESKCFWKGNGLN